MFTLNGIPLPVASCVHSHEGYVRTVLLDSEGAMKRTSTMLIVVVRFGFATRKV